MTKSMQAPSMSIAMTHRDQRVREAGIATPSNTAILIVDEDRSVGVALSSMLAAAGYDNVRAVRSANRALAVANQHRPAIAFVDLDLADGAAYGLATRLKREAKQRAIRFIALTKDNQHAAREAARDAGFDRFLVKPATQPELDRCLGKLPGSAP